MSEKEMTEAERLLDELIEALRPRYTLEQGAALDEVYMLFVRACELRGKPIVKRPTAPKRFGDE